MGALGDFLKGKKSEPKVERKEDTDSQVKFYNKVWLNKVSNQTGFIVSDNEKKVNGILEALNRKDGHCPCGGNGVQFLCPCIIMREKGICKCGLFENVRPLEPTGGSSGRIK